MPDLRRGRTQEPAEVSLDSSVFVDLSAQTERRVIVDRVTGHYLGQPHTLLLEDGRTALVAYPNGHGGPDTLLKRSDDGGDSWSPRLQVPRSFRGPHNAPTIHRLIAPDGTRRIFLNVSFPAMQSSLSEDDGATWTDLRPMWGCKWRRGYKGHAPMKSVIPISGKCYLGMYHDHFESDAGEQIVAPFTSVTGDGGRTWSEPTRVGQHPEQPGAQPCEPCLLRSPDNGSIVALLRENSRQYNSLMMTSQDEGETWSDMVELPASLTGDRHIARYGADGRIVVTMRDMAANSATYGDFVAWVGSWDDLQQQQPGQFRVRLLRNHGRPGDTGYAGLEVLPDGQLLSTTYCVLEKGESPLVVSLRFALDELDGPYSGKCSQNRALPRSLT